MIFLIGIVLVAGWVWWMVAGRKQDEEISADLRAMNEPEVEVDEFIARHHFADPQPAAYDTAADERAPAATAPPETQVMTWLNDHGVLPAQTQTQSQAQTTSVEHVVTQAAETADIAGELAFDPIEPLAPLKPLAPLPPLPPLSGPDASDPERAS